MLVFVLFCTILGEEEEEDGFFLGNLSKFTKKKEINWSKVDVHEIVIIGSGPAGCTAALYSARSGLNPIVFHGHIPGGQLTLTTEVENYPGFSGTGSQLIQKMQSQSVQFGAKYLHESVIQANLTADPKMIITDENNGYLARTVIIATGANAKFLGLSNEERFRNRGLSACATCDGPLFKNQHVAVVGGGDTAAHEAIHLSKLCKSVKLIVRSNTLRASNVMKNQLNKANIAILYETEVIELIGGTFLTGIQTKNSKTGSLKNLEVSALFIAIGHDPATAPFKDQVFTDPKGFFVTNGTKTNIPGVYVAGDCADKIFRQVSTSVGTGCQAAMLAEQYLIGINSK